MTYPVSVRRARRRGPVYGGGFLPQHLFRSGEQGVWFAPYDEATLFQDSAGTTPVTADGDPVGLMLDKSKGLVLGSELVTNGTFDTDTDWSKDSGVTISGGSAQATSNTAVNALFQNVGSVNGKKYLVEADVSTTTGGLECHFGGLSPQPFRSDSGRLQWVLGNPTGVNGFLVFGTNAWTGSIDNVSVRELPGNHATQTTSAARPVLDEPPEWFINFDGVDDKHTTTLPDLGTDVTIARASPGVGAVILTGQTIGAGPYDYSTDHAGLIIVNRALTAAETASLTAYLNKKAGV